MRNYHVTNFDQAVDFTDVYARRLTTERFGVTVLDDRSPRHSRDDYRVEKTFWLDRKTAKKLYKDLKKALKES